jgi:hypothetical protein
VMRQSVTAIHKFFNLNFHFGITFRCGRYDFGRRPQVR